MGNEADEAAANARCAARPRAARTLDAVLALAVLAAIALAVTGVVQDPGRLPRDAVASVNGQPIARAEFEAVLGRVGAQLSQQPGASERAEVLARMIDEELLIQRGLELGLARSEGRLRSLLVQEAMRQALAGVRAQPVGDTELATFFAQNAAYFAHPARLRVRRYDFPDASGAEAMRAVLDGSGGTAALARFEPARSVLLPEAALPEAKLREYLGAGLAARIGALAPGESLVEPREQGGVSVFLLLAVEPAETPPLAAIHAEVEAEFRRRRDEQALASYLAELREDAQVLIAGEAP